MGAALESALDGAELAVKEMVKELDGLAGPLEYQRKHAKPRRTRQRKNQDSASRIRSR
jgi:hypothetical protein